MQIRNLLASEFWLPKCACTVVLYECIVRSCFLRGVLMPPIHMRWFVHLLSLPWLVLWITTVPLFHLHIPDTTDRWSMLQSGGAHTVLTPDLPGEFSPPVHDSEPGHSGHLSSRTVN